MHGFILYVIQKPHNEMQHSLIQELILYKFKLGYEAIKATKNIYCVKDKGTVNHSTVTKWF